MKPDALQSVESELRLETEQKPEQPKIRESVSARSERRDRLVTQLAPLLNTIQKLESERVRWSYEFMRETLIKRPKELFLFAEADRLRADVNRVIDAIDVLRPSGTQPLKRLHTNPTEMAALARMANLRAINLLKRQTGVVVRPQDEVNGDEMFKTMSRYLTGSDSHDVFRTTDVLQMTTERVDGYWKPLEQSWQSLGVDEDTESQKEVAPDQAERTAQSFRNMRERVRAFISSARDRVVYRAVIQEDDNARSYSDVAREAVQILKRNIEKEGSEIRFVYYEQPEDVQAILDSQSIKQLSELSPEEQDRNKKSEWKTTSEIVEQRREVERALGWVEELPVYHLVAESDVDERLTVTGPADNYGFVGFVMDVDRLPVVPTFTEGDSLNPAPLPNFYPQNRGGDAVRQREIIREHVPLAKAIMHEAQKRDPDPLRNMLRYVEVQVGGVTGAELFQSIREVTIHARAMESFYRHESPAKQAAGAAQRKQLEAWCAERGIAIRIIP